MIPDWLTYMLAALIVIHAIKEIAGMTIMVFHVKRRAAPQQKAAPQQQTARGSPCGSLLDHWTLRLERAVDAGDLGTAEHTLVQLSKLAGHDAPEVASARSRVEALRAKKRPDQQPD